MLTFRAFFIVRKVVTPLYLLYFLFDPAHIVGHIDITPGYIRQVTLHTPGHYASLGEAPVRVPAHQGGPSVSLH